ncbi:G patch domain and ankyrin repeat-containing protein 1 [Oryzias melastigma]|uniref:G patch domain and ankyrin repeat-containing protein 1 n=1 Tax=Oryzias melastigma TaxID=30732 RepID=A0A834FLG7_ORYME|nr:G patch domain and ankyrin repeat-containing protein 1 [Oryzias melastigma]
MAAFGFTRASNEDVFSVKVEDSVSKISTKVSGEEVRHFYEDLIRTDGDGRRNTKARKEYGHERQKNRKRRRVRAAAVQQAAPESVGTGGETESNQSRESGSERTQELQGLRLLRCAHEGDTAGIRDLLSKGADINYQDTFLWTAVMCAAWSGQRSAVRLLLRHGAAWVGVVDTQGRDAQDLALEAGHRGVLEELMNNGRSPERESSADDSAVQPQWCATCSTHYRSSTSSHLSSTLHQFNLHRPPPTPYYCLPPSSNSYKMMLRCGWKPGTGLGPEGEGPQQPVPTVLKRDQQGLGYGQTKKAKVTHFRAKDQDAVKLPCRERTEMGLKGQKKEEARRKEQRDKNWERDFRSSFYL